MQNNLIYTPDDETIGLYSDIVRWYKNEIREAIERDDLEEARARLEELEEINEHKGFDGLLILSENNGMGFTCSEYKGRA